MAGQDWDQKFATNPITKLRASDLIYALRQGSPDADVVGEWGVVSSRATAVYVNPNGDDTNGNGSLLCPYATVAAAMAAITDATITKQYVINMTGAITESVNVVLKPFVHLSSDGAPWYVATMSLHADFNTAANIWQRYMNLSFASNATFTLHFTDATLVFGYIEFINCRCTRISSIPTPTITFSLNSPNGYHHFEFWNCEFSQHNDGDAITISLPVDGQAPMSFIGGNLPTTINYTNSASGGDWIYINGSACSGNTTTITANNTALYLNNISRDYGALAINVDSNSSVSYDSSIGDTSVFTVTGTGNSFFALTTDKVLKGTYSPTNYTVPNPGIFQNTGTLYDHLNGIDNALGAGLDTGFIYGLEQSWNGVELTTINPGNVNVVDGSSLVKLTYAGGTSVDISASGFNGLDTGTVAADTWYYIMAIGGAGQTPGFIYTTTPASPTFPTNYTYGRPIGIVRTNASAADIMNYNCQGLGNHREYEWVDNANAATTGLFNSGASGTFSTNGAQPPSAGSLRSNTITISASLGVATAGDTAVIFAPSTTYKKNVVVCSATGVIAWAQFTINNLDTQQLTATISNAASDLVVFGTRFEIDI